MCFFYSFYLLSKKLYKYNFISHNIYLNIETTLTYKDVLPPPPPPPPIVSVGYECICVVYRAFSYDVTAAILVFQNKETAAILVYQTNPPGIELYFYANIIFCFRKPIWPVAT